MKEMMKVDLRKISSLDGIIVGETILVVEELVIGVDKNNRELITAVRGEDDKIVVKTYRCYKDGKIELFEAAYLTKKSTEYEEFDTKLRVIGH